MRKRALVLAASTPYRVRSRSENGFHYRSEDTTGMGKTQVLAAIALAGLAATGCATSVSTSAASTSGGSSVVQVVAAENFWGSLASQLGGAHAHVTSIIDNPNADPHSYEPTASDARAMAAARLAVINGIGYDGWASKLVAADPVAGRVVLSVGDGGGVRPGG